MQKACGHPQGAPTVWGRMISGSLSLPSEGFFSPFPHGTRALSVGNGIQPCGMGPTDSDGVSRVPPYLGVPRRGTRLRARGCHPLWRAFPGPCARSCPRLQGIPQPRRMNPPVWASFRVRSPLLAESLLISSPRGTEMFHFPRFASAAYLIQLRMQRYGPLRIAPFGNPRIKGRLRLPADYRGLPRPSSPVAAKASVMRPNSLPANSFNWLPCLSRGNAGLKPRAPVCCNARPPHGERAALTCGALAGAASLSK